MSTRSSVKVDDKKWRRIKRDIATMSRLGTKVGIQSDAGADSENNPIIVRAVANEFGTGRIPERSFVRASFDEKEKLLKRTIDRLWQGVLAGRLTPGQALHLLGQMHEGHVKEKIVDLKEPPNAPSTIKKKGSSNPLIDTSQMLNSVRYKVEGM